MADMSTWGQPVRIKKEIEGVKKIDSYFFNSISDICLNPKEGKIVLVDKTWGWKSVYTDKYMADSEKLYQLVFTTKLLDSENIRKTKSDGWYWIYNIDKISDIIDFELVKSKYMIPDLWNMWSI